MIKIVIEKNPESRLNDEQKKLRGGKGFVYHQSSQPFYQIKVLLKNLETEPELYVNGIKKYIYKTKQLIKLLNVIEELKQGITRIHCGAVVNKKNEGIIITGWQDTGKTTVTFWLGKKNGYSILGDEAIKLSQSGKMFRMHNKAGIYPHPENLKLLQLSSKEKFLGWLKYNLLSIFPPFASNFQPNIPIKYSRISKMLDTAYLARVFILERSDESGIYPINKSEAIYKIMATSLSMSTVEGFPKRLFYNYCYMNNLDPTFIEKDIYKILDSVLENKEIFVIKGTEPHEFYQLLLKHENNQL